MSILRLPSTSVSLNLLRKERHMAITSWARLGAGCVLVALWLLTSPQSCPADEKPIDLAKLPAKVKKAANDAVPGAKWKEAFTDEDEGKVFYTLEGTDAKGRNVSVEVTAEGKVNEVETEIPLKDVPKVVMDALRAKMPKFKISAVSEVRQEGKVVGYNFDGQRPAKDKEDITVSVSADGKTIEIDDGKDGKPLLR